ncbi:MAG TPA: hypothetical protein VNH18_14195, partial [Bryobacteraceae bacterium]|nr:hypothetical protein [Bryobacteraceae bacterium]
MIDPEKLAGFRVSPTAPAKSERGGFDMETYLKKHGFEVLRRKPWPSHPGGEIIELCQCPFDANHGNGSAAFTMNNGKPGFKCQHDGCRGKTIRDVLASHPASRHEGDRPSAESEPGADDTPRKRAQSQLLVECAAGAELFHTPHGESFGSLPVGDHREIWPLRSKGCRCWIARQFYQKFQKPSGAQAMQDCVATLEAVAQFDGPELEVFTRIAAYEGGICVDLCNEKWEVAVITAAGWRVESNSPVRFRRSKGMLALPSPARNGSMSKLRSLINVGDDKNWVLLLSWLLAACRPTGPYPVLIFEGEQGSAKSTTAKLLRRVIDHSSALLRTPPREERDLLIAANNSWVVAYDNLSGVPQWLSDALCRLATGGGFSTRELYTDTDEVILDLMRPVILNSIDHLAERADLADRAIVLNLPRIDDSARRDEAQLYVEYEQEQPQILGSLFDALSAALARFPETKLPKKPRMADFALWATAGEEGFGFTNGAFMAAYSGNRAEAVQETLAADPVSESITAMMTNQEMDIGPWTGTSGELLKLLEGMVGDSVRKARSWPRTPRGFSSQLRRLATFLREAGIDITFPDPDAKSS